MASETKFATHKEAKDAGWYSRRHRTREESEAMKEAHPYTGRRNRKKRKSWVD